MLIIIQLATILGMIFLTYVGFLSFGSPKAKLLFTKEEKAAWDQSISAGLGKWFTITNIIGSLTSLATVYLFFIGSSKLFGWVTFMCTIAIFGSSIVTNYFTRKIFLDDYLSKLLESKAQVGGVIATLFWRPNDPTAQLTSRIVKWLSLLNIVGTIWLEFALFSDIAGRLFHLDYIYYNLLIVLVVSFSVLFFIVKYGLRGFVFSDAFQSPIIAISALSLVIGSSLLLYKNGTSIPFSEIFKPLVTQKECGLFGLHVLFLNLFFVTVTEGHWLRVWIFGRKETDMQIKSLFATSLIWSLLILVGFLAFTFSNSKIGIDVIVSLIHSLYRISPVFLVFFWLGAMASLFATADAQIYSFLLVFEFNHKSGELSNKLLARPRPFILAGTFAIIFCIFYYLTRTFDIRFEKIVFIIMPMCLNLLPAFVRAAQGKQQIPRLIILSVILYSICMFKGLFQAENELAYTLAAALIPIGFSIFAYFRK